MFFYWVEGKSVGFGVMFSFVRVVWFWGSCLGFLSFGFFSLRCGEKFRIRRFVWRIGLVCVYKLYEGCLRWVVVVFFLGLGSFVFRYEESGYL